MASLTDKPITPHWGCTICGRGAAESGPFWTTDVVLAGTDRPLVFCASCSTTQLKALDVVPRARLIEASQNRQQLVDAEHIASQRWHQAEAKIAKLTKRVNDLVAANESLTTNLGKHEQRAREQETERKRTFLASIAADVDPEAKTTTKRQPAKAAA